MNKPRSPKSATIATDDANVIGIRAFRDHLSAYLERVKAGDTLTITEHGKPIAMVVGSSLPFGLVDLIARGAATVPTRSLSDLHKVKRAKITGSTQDLIDGIR